MLALVLAGGLGLAGAALSGCGSSSLGSAGSTPGPGYDASSSTPTVPAPTTATAPTGSLTGSPTVEVPTVPARTSPRGAATTLSGTLNRDSVEGGCVVLTVRRPVEHAGTRYVLVGNPEAVRRLVSGTDVTVAGRADSTVATTCQNGTPFVIDEVLAQPDPVAS